MMVHVPEVLSKAQARDLRALVEAGDWIDGNATSGPQAALAKRNMQMPGDSPVARQGADVIMAALKRSSLFFTAALPLKIFPPLFNRYGAGNAFAPHVDNAVRFSHGGAEAVRTDLAATLFLSEPEEYEGGELTVEDTYGVHQVKLPAGDLVVYPASSVHQVLAIGSGARLAAFFWIQSMIRNETNRNLLFQMDRAIGEVRAELGDTHSAGVSLTACYHNLLRAWAEM
jgi:PKHD-type hydroxylase